MSVREWIDFSFRHNGEAHLVCSWEDAEAHIASGALNADTRVTAFLPSGRKAMDARDLEQLPFAPASAAAQVSDIVLQPDAGEADEEPSAALGALNSDPEPDAVPAKKRPQKKVPARRPPPVSAAFKAERIAPKPIQPPASPPPRWLADPVWIQPLHRYVEFSGRSSRLEYWSYALAQFIALFTVGLFAMAVGETLGALIVTLVSLGLFIPNLAVTVRRLHDINLSGWLLLLMIVPMVIGGGVAVLAGIGLLIVLCVAGSPGRNDHGEPSPR
jgi:uncharacterized membrane protein YhaH (DUF805 family)